MSDERLQPRQAATRRQFLQAAGLATAGVTAIVVGPGARAGESRRRVGAGGAHVDDDCGCRIEPALALRAAAYFQGGYVGLVAGDAGLGLHSLSIDATQRVSLGGPIDVDLPSAFTWGSLGVHGGRLIVTGAMPFLFESYDVDYEADPAVLEAMDDVPRGLRTQGSGRIDVLGLRPAAFEVDAPFARPLRLPDMPRRVFAVASALAETDSGSLALMIEHSDTQNESWYAAAVDVLEQRNGRFTVHALGRGLGESGPNHLAVDADGIAVGLRTSRGFSLARPGRPALAAPAQARRILGLTRGPAGVELLGAEEGGVRRFAPAGDRWSDAGATSVERDELVAAVNVGGTKGESILLGRRAALLVDERGR